jgi:hypothetical protein
MLNAANMRPKFFRKRGEPEEITPVSGPMEAQAEASGIDHFKSLREFEKNHKLDPNLPIDELNDVDAAIATGNAEKGIEIEHALMEDNSPYPEVCSQRNAVFGACDLVVFQFGQHDSCRPTRDMTTD